MSFANIDPVEGYRADVMTAPRKKDEDRILAERFVGSARQVEVMTAYDEFHQKFSGELARVYTYLGLPASLGAEKLFDLHHRHAEQVGRVMLAQMKELAELRRTEQLVDTCVTSYAFDPAKRPDASPAAPANDIATLRSEINRLNERERACVQALYEKNIIGAGAENRPSQKTLSEWAGYLFDTTFKNTLSTVVKAGFVSNGRHEGTRGGYFLTVKGERAGQLLCDQT